MILHQSDGQRGIIRYRDFPIEDLFRDYVYEDIMHLVIWGQVPTLKQKEDARVFMGEAAIPPQSVVDVISAFPFVLRSKQAIDQGLLTNVVTDAIPILIP